MTTAPSDKQPLIYEVRLTVDPAITTDFDTWLDGHVRAILALPGFRGARTIRADPAPDGRARRLVRYRVRDRAALEDYMQHHAEGMRQDGVERFGDRFSAERDVYPAADGNHHCPECGTTLE